MASVCEVCGAVDGADEAVQQASGVCLDDLHVCENCRKDRQPVIQMPVTE